MVPPPFASAATARADAVSPGPAASAGPAAREPEVEGDSEENLRPRTRVFFALNLGWLAAGVVFAVQLVVLGVLDPGDAAWLALLDWGPWLLLSPAIIWLALRVPIEGPRWGRAVALHVAACLAVVAVLGAVTGRLFELRSVDFHDQRRAAPADRSELPPPPMMDVIRARFAVPIYVVLVLGANAWLHHRRGRARERRALRAEARLAEARLAALQAQLQPHFLFNALNAISGLIHTQPRQADAMLCAFSELLRGVLAVAGKKELPLAEELALAERYLEIQRMRFSDRLTVRREVPPDLLRAVVPALVLQPLVENAVVHGVAPRASAGEVRVSARREDARLVLEVVDDGAGFSPGGAPAGTGVGLANVRARLEALHGADASLLVAPREGGGTVARVELPWREVLP